MGWDLLVTAVVGLAAAWFTFLIALAVRRPDAAVIAESIRLVPDTVRLVRRLAADRTVGGVRLRLWLLLAYLVSPVDLVPDFIPVLGLADDIVITALVLRSVARAAGPEPLRRHWPGTPGGFATLVRLCRIEVPSASGGAAHPDDMIG